jgi:hypothetical protein
MPAPGTDAFPGTAGEQPSAALGAGPVLAAENGAEARWADALQDLDARLETLQAQGGLLPPSIRWAPETRSRATATILRVKTRAMALEAVVGAGAGEAAGRHGHDDVEATPPPPAAPPVADAAQGRGNRERIPRSSAQDPNGDAADGDRRPSQPGGEGSLGCDRGRPVHEDESRRAEDPPVASRRPTRGRDGKDAPAGTRTRRPHAEGPAAPTSEGRTRGVPEASAGALTDPSGGATGADPAEPVAPDGQPAGQGAIPTAPNDRCGWCGSTRVWPADTGAGRIHCRACHAVYNPSTRLWAPGEQDKRHSPPASMPAAAA